MNKNLFIDDCKRSGNIEVDEYIEMLESIVKEYYSDNANRMIFEANRIIGIIADDLEHIADDGTIRRTKIIKEEKNNLLMERIVLLLKQTDVVTSISKKSVDAGRAVKARLKKQSDTSTKLEIKIDPDASNEPTEPIEETEPEDDYISEFANSVSPIEELIKKKEAKNK